MEQPGTQSLSFRPNSTDAGAEIYSTYETVTIFPTTSSTWKYTVTEIGRPSEEFDGTADKIFGSILCMFFVFGTFGNIASFIYFQAQKRDITCTTYMMITANDIILSVSVLPIGISLLSGRDPGKFFENEICCAVWWYIWFTTTIMSVFLVTCLCVTRTLLLLKPFYSQRIRFLIAATVIYLLLQTAQLIGFHKMATKLQYVVKSIRPTLIVHPKTLSTTGFQLLLASKNITLVIPMIVVATCCALSATSLIKKRGKIQLEKEQAPNRRDTVTILLFALIYGVCNLPLVVDNALTEHAYHTAGENWYNELHSFDKQWYYYNTVHLGLIAANSAANPVFYLWRMSPLREYILSTMWRLTGTQNRTAGYQAASLTDQPSEDKEANAGGSSDLSQLGTGEVNV